METGARGQPPEYGPRRARERILPQARPIGNKLLAPLPARRAARGHLYSSKRLYSTQALVPPNPKELHRA
jgi:hypothetical protein